MALRPLRYASAGSVREAAGGRLVPPGSRSRPANCCCARLEVHLGIDDQKLMSAIGTKLRVMEIKARNIA